MTVAEVKAELEPQGLVLSKVIEIAAAAAYFDFDQGSRSLTFCCLLLGQLLLKRSLRFIRQTSAFPWIDEGVQLARVQLLAFFFQMEKPGVRLPGKTSQGILRSSAKLRW